MNKIIIVDDHSLFREGIKLLIENEELGEVIAEADNGQEFIKLLDTHTPDLVIMDIEMPVMNGIEASKKGLFIQPNLKILILTMMNEKTNYMELIQAGVMGFVLKTSGKNEFEKAIKTIMSGENYLAHDLMQLLEENNAMQNAENAENQHSKTPVLTSREQEVLVQLCKGFSVSEIADQLFLSVKTIESHRASLLRKTDTKNTINLVLYGLKHKVELHAFL